MSQFFTSVAKVLEFQVQISPFNEYSGLISFRMDWLDLLAVQGTLKSLLQHHSSKASSLQCSGFFIVQISHPYMTTRKTKALTRLTFVGKIMSLRFNVIFNSLQKCFVIFRGRIFSILFVKFIPECLFFLQLFLSFVFSLFITGV